LIASIDHLVYACPDLEATCHWIAATTGVAPAMGGQHPGGGTRNALLSLGASTYLELIGPDTEQPTPSRSRPFGLDSVRSPSLRGWAAAPGDITLAVVEAGRHEHALADPVQGRRRTPAGVELSWTMALPKEPVAETPDGSPGTPEAAVLPFLIDWQQSAHPARTSPAGLVLERFVLLSRAPSSLRGLLADALGLDGPWEIVASPTPGLYAEIVGKAGARIALVS
jgi:hypothetical protein